MWTEFFVLHIDICLQMFRFFSQLGYYMVLIRPSVLDIMPYYLFFRNRFCSSQVSNYPFPADFQGSDSFMFSQLVHRCVCVNCTCNWCLMIFPFLNLAELHLVWLFLVSGGSQKLTSSHSFSCLNQIALWIFAFLLYPFICRWKIFLAPVCWFL